jgi:uncharacterized membrane protein YccF (DUF307 family)
MSIVYFMAGVLAFVLIITIPFGVQAFKMSNYVLWPFGRTVMKREDATTFWTLVGNVIWILIGAWWLAIIHLLIAVLFFITIVGIPFAKANVKFARMILTPFGLRVVDEVDITDNAVLIIDQLGVTTPNPVRYD